MKHCVTISRLLRMLQLMLCCVCGLTGANAQNYQLITSTDELEPGTTYLIASMADGTGTVMAPYASGYNHKVVSAQSNGGVITWVDGMAKLTLFKDAAARYQFQEPNGTYMSATNMDKNCLQTSNSATDQYACFSISFQNGGECVIKCTGKNTRNILRYNYNNGSSLYACYTDGQQPVYLYKQVAEETKEVASVTISGTATKVSYMVGEKPSADGLTVEATFEDGTTQDVTNKVAWTFAPETIVEGTTQVTATATYGDKSTTITYEIAIKTQTVNDSYILDLTTNTSTSASTKQVVWNTGVGTLVLDKGTSSTPANNYLGSTAGHTRTYSGQIMTINPTISIAKVVFTCPSSTYANLFKGYTLTNADKYISGSNVELVPEEPLSPITITFNQACRFTKMVIYTTISATISDAGYATLCLPYAGIMPEGVTAYAAKDNGTNITLIEREGGLIAAEEGVLLKGAAGTYSFAAKLGAVAKADVNNLVGITEDTPLKSEDGVYLLSRNKTTNKTAFRLLDANYTLSAHKAYLKPEGVSYSRLMIDIDDEVETGINTVSGQENGTKTNVIYNLAGQRMSRATKGINIVNGKLILK